MYICTRITNVPILMKDRLFEIIENLNITPAEFADTIGISRSAVSSIKTGRTLPTLGIVAKIINAYPQISTDWLVLGTGSMYRENFTPADSPVNSPAGQPEVETAEIIENQQQHLDFDAPSLNNEPDDIPNHTPIPTQEPQYHPTAAAVPTTSAPKIDNGPTPIQPDRPTTPTRQPQPDKPATPERRIIRIITLYSDGTYQQFSPE